MPRIENLADLRKVKESAASRILARGRAGTRIVVRLGACGIASGARDVMRSLMDELQKREVKNVTLETSGCVGMCLQEPMLDVVGEDGAKVTYGRVKPSDAPRIVSGHILDGQPVRDLLVARAN
jgi:NADP-reducing hydrogenase subunit HndB